MRKVQRAAVFSESSNFSGKEGVSVNLAVFFFEEDGQSIAYCPALDLSGYGNNEFAADADFKVVLAEYFRYTVEMNTIFEDLESHGWTVLKTDSKKLVAPDEDPLRKNNEVFNGVILRHPDAKRIERPIQNKYSHLWKM